MPLPKEFYFAGDRVKKNYQVLPYVIFGILGALITGADIIICGLTQTQTSPHVYYVIGASLMLVTAIYYRLTYFVALELIFIAGHGAVLLGIGTVSQVVLPILLSIQLFVYYLLSGQLKNIYRLIGIAGIVLISIGFSYENPWVFLFGSLGISIFSFYHVYRGYKIALLWAILNTIFVIDIFFKLVF